MKAEEEEESRDLDRVERVHHRRVLIQVLGVLEDAERVRRARVHKEILGRSQHSQRQTLASAIAQVSSLSEVVKVW